MSNIKLSLETRQIIGNIVEVGKKFNIDVFTLDKSGIRAKSDEKFVFLYKDEANDNLEFDSLCINRITDFNNRISLIEDISTGNYSMEIVSKELDSGGSIVTKLGLRTKKAYFEVGCADASLYKMFKSINDDPLVSFTIDEEGMRIIKGIARTVRNKNKTINIKAVNGVITVNAVDVEGDSATAILSTSPEFTDDEPTEFSFIYKVNNLLPLLATEERTITLTTKGLLTSEELGITAIILAEGAS